MTSIKKHSTAVLTATILAAALTIPATATVAPVESIRVSSYKGSALEVGKRSGLIIGPNMAKSGMNPKTLQYLMGHSDIGVTLNNLHAPGL